MNENGKFNRGQKRRNTSHGMDTGGSGMISSGMSGTASYEMIRSVAQPAMPSRNVSPSKDNAQNRTKNYIPADSMSYSLQTTTIPEQASKESNFIGSAWFYNLSINQVKISMAGEYVIVYARPKTSKSFPRGEGIEIFDPNFKNRLEIKTERPKEVTPEANKIGYLITNKGFFGVGALYFHGRRVDLYFEPPYQSKQVESPVQTEAWNDQQHPGEPTTFLDEVLDYGVRQNGTVAKFGVKDMVTMFNVPHGFYFIALDLAVWNLKTGQDHFHHIIGVKMPEKGEVSSAFILKQPIEFPHHTCIRWQKYTSQEEKRRNALLPVVEKEIPDVYENETDRQATGKRDIEGMDWTNVV